MKVKSLRIVPAVIPTTMSSFQLRFLLIFMILMPSTVYVSVATVLWLHPPPFYLLCLLRHRVLGPSKRTWLVKAAPSSLTMMTMKTMTWRQSKSTSPTKSKKWTNLQDVSSFHWTSRPRRSGRSLLRLPNPLRKRTTNTAVESTWRRSPLHRKDTRK